MVDFGTNIKEYQGETITKLEPRTEVRINLLGLLDNDNNWTLVQTGDEYELWCKKVPLKFKVCFKKYSEKTGKPIFLLELLTINGEGLIDFFKEDEIARRFEEVYTRKYEAIRSKKNQRYDKTLDILSELKINELD